MRLFPILRFGLRQYSSLEPATTRPRPIAQVARDFHAALPGAEVYVYDNNSTDGTVRGRARGRRRRECARPARARAMWCAACSAISTPTSSCWSTATPPTTPPACPILIERLAAGRPDMVVGGATSARISAAYRVAATNSATARSPASSPPLFGKELARLLSGYRVMSRRFVKSFRRCRPASRSRPELTVHAPRARPADFRGRHALFRSARPGRSSKLNTWRRRRIYDIHLTILWVYRSERPLILLCGGRRAVGRRLSVLLAVPVVVTYVETGLVPRIPTAVLSTGLIVSGLPVDRGRFRAAIPFRRDAVS